MNQILTEFKSTLDLSSENKFKLTAFLISLTSHDPKIILIINDLMNQIRTGIRPRLIHQTPYIFTSITSLFGFVDGFDHYFLQLQAE